MKKIKLLILLISGSITAWCQSNNFPLTGDATINSGNLIQTGVYNLQTQSSVKLKNYLLFDSDGDFIGDNYYTIQDHSTGNYLRMGYNWSNHLVIGSSGNIGLGLTNPTSNLTIYGTNAEGWESGIELNREGGNQAKIVVDNDGLKLRTMNSGDNFYFRNSGNRTTMFIKSDGNVGVGTTNPIAKLHVSSSTSGDAVFKLEADTDNNNEGDNSRIELLLTGRLEYD